MTELKEVFGFNKYCGPAVLSALTGKSTDACASAISRISGKREIKAVDVNHLVSAARLLGFDTEGVCTMSGTLFGSLNELHKKPGFYIILVPHHVIAVEIKDSQIYLIDNHTKQAINAAASARLMQRVEKIWQVKPKPQPTQEDLTRQRITFIRGQIDMLNREISSRVSQRENLIKELEQLEKERDNDNKRTSSVGCE